ncbi:hypothetical protein ACQCVE_00555 [Metabacillus sp. 113a]|uniref:hypothetical protein n=1 Tax=Metabacillus sp. 113a TaxID=3404706 RepID=UPI003CED327C
MDKEHKKKRGAVKTAGFVCAAFLAAGVFSSPVQAYFSKDSQQTIGIQMGSWWDGSKLRYEQTENLVCETKQVIFSVKNNGFAMTGGTDYRIYLNDEVIEEGSLEEIGEDRSAQIMVSTEEPGTYYAKIAQRPGYEGEEDKTVWTSSGKITAAACGNPEIEDEQEAKPETKDEKKAMRVNPEAQDEKKAKRVNPEPQDDQRAKSEDPETQEKQEEMAKTLQPKGEKGTTESPEHEDNRDILLEEQAEDEEEAIR